MKSEASLRERLMRIARGIEKGGNHIARVVWTILPKDPNVLDLIPCFSVNEKQMDKIVSKMFDLSLSGYYVAHVFLQGWGDYGELWFKIRKSDTHQTNITSDTIAALLTVLEPTLGDRKDERA